ncbi:TetR/AcrR family transcriptional regulator [Paenibacillus sp. 1P07SE]|uniref:TetR/AcrR family transcriptional regulator n=1 Tax=Paenibacillus sp. 1P07SE TaxID=3132209 RepID=UPI0039A656A7
MARYTREQTDQIREERESQILKAALQVFSENGIQNTKMSMIAKASGLSQGLAYHYFASKEDVLTKCLLWATKDANQLIEEVRGLAAVPLDKIAYFTRSALAAGSQEVFRLIQICLTAPELDEEVKQLIEVTRESYVELFIPIIQEGQQCGQVIDEDPHKLANLYLAVLSGLIVDDAAWLGLDLEWNVNRLLRILQ